MSDTSRTHLKTSCASGEGHSAIHIGVSAPVDVPAVIHEDDLSGEFIHRRVSDTKPKKNKGARILEALPTYSIPNRKANTPHVARLHKLASLLQLHHIHRGATLESNNELHESLDFLAQQAGQALTDRMHSISHIVIVSQIYPIYGAETQIDSGPLTRSIEAAKSSIDDAFKAVDKA